MKRKARLPTKEPRPYEQEFAIPSQLSVIERDAAPAMRKQCTRIRRHVLAGNRELARHELLDLWQQRVEQNRTQAAKDDAKRAVTAQNRERRLGRVHNEHRRWKTEADAIRERNPELSSRQAVARIIKKT
jgi:hypothetical protein